MLSVRDRFLTIFFGCLALCLAQPGSAAVAAGPVTIEFKLTALDELGRYEYRYTVTNFSSTVPVSWFSIDFDTASYEESSLQIKSVGLSDWSQQLLGSVLNNPAQYDAYKREGPPLGIGSFAEGFAVEFTWLGSGRPGNQAFAVYDPGDLSILYSGVTVPVPEPSTLALALAGLCGVAVTAGRRRRQPERAARADDPRS